MIEFLTDKITTLVENFVSEQEGKIKDFINKKKEEKSLEKRLKESSKRFFDEKIENSLRIEEIDFPALNEYVKEELCKQIKDILLELDLNKKEKDKEIFLNSCINISGAETENEKRTVKLYVEIAIDIIKSFFVGENPESLRVLFSEFSENIEKYIDKSTEKIKEAVKNSMDKNSFEYLIDSINPKTQSTSPFHFRNDIITFRGREEEQEEIFRFLNDKEYLRWMAITGDGGSGKSKLMYHMTQRLESGNDWKVIWLEDESLKSILEKTEFKYSKSLLFICDYGGQFSEKLRTLINTIDSFRNDDSGKKIRLIILEREGFTENCGDILEPMWYKSFRGGLKEDDHVDSTAFYKNKSLKLNSLNDDDFKRIVKDYLAEKKKSLSDEKINTVIKKAHEIDNRKTGARPLILLFVADAVADGNEAENWDLNKLVEHVINRYEDHWKNVICKGDRKLYEAVKEITVYATAVGGWDLRNKKIGEPIKSAIDLFFRKVNDKNMFLCSICEKDKSDGIWSPFEPDLIGEFFVLEFLRNKIENYDEDYVSDFSKLCWTKGNKFWWFLYRCSQNYRKRKKFKKIFVNGMEIFETEDEENAVMYSYIIDSMIDYKSEKETCILLGRLKNLCNKYPEQKEFKKIYSEKFGEFVIDKNGVLNKKSIDDLEEFCIENAEDENIQAVYSNVLCELIEHQIYPETEKTIEKLEILAERNRNIESIQIDYAYALYSLSCRNEYPEIVKIMKKVKNLSEKYPHLKDIQIHYKNCINNLIEKILQISGD